MKFDFYKAQDFFECVDDYPDLKTVTVKDLISIIEGMPLWVRDKDWQIVLAESIIQWLNKR